MIYYCLTREDLQLHAGSTDLYVDCYKYPWLSKDSRDEVSWLRRLRM